MRSSNANSDEPDKELAEFIDNIKAVDNHVINYIDGIITLMNFSIQIRLCLIGRNKKE